MGPSQGVRRVNQIELVDRSTYEGVRQEGCPPRDLATKGQGHSSESPGGLIHPSGAMPLQYPSDLFVPSLTARTESAMVDWRAYGPLGPESVF